MCGHDYPDPVNTPPDDEPVEGVRVKCWNCGGDGDDSDLYLRSRPRKCRACGGTGYTYDTTETEDTEEDEDEV